MSSGGSATPTFHAPSNTARAVGAFFGMLGFNLLLIAIALVLRRVTRNKSTTKGNSVEMKNGKYNRKKASLTDDVEKAEAKHINDAEKAAAHTSSAQRDNDAFVDVDLESDSKEPSQAVYESRNKSEGANAEAVYESRNKNEGANAEAVYESRNKSEGANADNDYSNLTDVKVSVSSEPEDVHYENYEGDQAKVAFSGTSEADVIY